MLRLGARAARRRPYNPSAGLVVLRAEVAGRRRVWALVAHGLQGRDQQAKEARVGVVPRARGGGFPARRRRTGREPGGASRRRTPPPHLRVAPSSARDGAPGDLTDALGRAARV